MRVSHACLTILCLATISIFSGCEPLLEPDSDEFMKVSASAASPEVLLEQIHEKQQTIRTTSELHARAGGAFRLRVMRMHAESGLDLADQVLAHADATAEQRSEACQAKLKLLNRAAEQDFADFNEQLDEFVNQVRAELPQSPEAELADVLLLEQLIVRGEEFDDLMSALQEHAKDYPDGKRGVKVFQKYAEHLIKQNDLPHAMLCCEAGLKLYSQHPESTSLQLLLSNMRRYLAAEESKRVAKKARLSRIARQLGYRDEGYFLIYAHENKGIGMIEVEYHIAQGASAAADYVDTLKQGWIWEVHRWFPHTRQGELEAEQELNKCLKGCTRSFF